MPRFLRFSYSEIAFVNYGGVVEVNGMVMGPCMVRNSGTFSRCFYISYVFFSSGVKRSASFTNITPRTVGARNFVNNIGLRIRSRAKLRGRELLL